MSKSLKINFQQERDFSDKINVTFQFISENFKLLILSLLYLAGPLILLSGIFGGLLQVDVLNSSLLRKIRPIIPKDNENLPAEVFGEILGRNTEFIFSANYLLSMLFGFLSTIMVVTIVYSFVIEYQESDDPSKISPTMIWERVKTLYLTILSSFLSVSLVFFGILAVFGGFISMLASGMGSGIFVNLSLSLTVILACITVVYLGIIFLLNTPIVTFEYTGIWEAFGRANYLIQKKWWSTFGIFAIFFIINYFLSLLFSLPSILVNTMGILKLKLEIGESISVVVTTILATLGRIFLSSLTYLAITFQYFSLVERKEGNSLKSQISEIGQKNRPYNDDEEY
jgi:hypothetical protein